MPRAKIDPAPPAPEDIVSPLRQVIDPEPAWSCPCGHMNQEFHDKYMASFPPPDPKPEMPVFGIGSGLTLAQKLVEITAAVGTVAKDGFNEEAKYSFVRESVVTNTIRPEMVKRHVLLHATVVGYQRALHDGRLLDVTYSFQFMDADTGETFPASEIVMSGWDEADKSASKAMTNAKKYFLLNAFMIGTGDDPEADTKTDRVRAAEEAAGGEKVRGRVSRGSTSGVQRGGRSALATDAQIREVAVLMRDRTLSAGDIFDEMKHTLGLEATLQDGVEPNQQLKVTLQGLSSTDIGKLIMALSAGGQTGGQAVDETPAAAEVVDETDVLTMV